MKRLFAGVLALAFLAPNPAFANNSIDVGGSLPGGPSIPDPARGGSGGGNDGGGSDPSTCNPPTVEYDSGSYTLNYRNRSVSGQQPFGSSKSADELAAGFGGWRDYALNLPETRWNGERVSNLVGGTWSKATRLVYGIGCERTGDGGVHDSLISMPATSSPVYDRTQPFYSNGWCVTRVRAEISGPYTRAFDPWPNVEFLDAELLFGSDENGWRTTAYEDDRSAWLDNCVGQKAITLKFSKPISDRGRYVGQFASEGDRLAIVLFPSGSTKWGWTGQRGNYHRTILEQDRVYDEQGVYRTINCENDNGSPATKVSPDDNATLDRSRAAWSDGNQYYYTESYGSCNGTPTNPDGTVPPSPQDPDGTGGTPDTLPGSNASLPQIGIRCEADRQYPKYTLADGIERTNGSDIVQVRADNKATKIDWLPNNPVGVEVTGGSVVGDIVWRSRFSLSPTEGENSPSLVNEDVNNPEQPYGTVAYTDIDRENANPSRTWFDLDAWVDEDGNRTSSADRQDAPVAGFGVRFADASKQGRYWRSTPEWEATFTVRTSVLQNDSFTFTNGLTGGFTTVNDDSSVNGNGSYRTQDVQLTYVCLGRNSRLQAQRVSTVPIVTADS